MARDVLAFLRLTRGERLVVMVLLASISMWGFSLGLDMMR